MPPDFGYALGLSLMGFAITFAVLALIAAVVRVVRKLDEGWREQELEARRQLVHEHPTIDDLTVVLIAAAVATVLKGRGRIRSIRRLTPADKAGSAWSVQGRMVLMGSHVISRPRS